jgi:hypothetical protein
MLRRPTYPPIMASFTIAPETMKRIIPPTSSPVYRTCSDLISNSYFSQELVKAATSLRDLMYCDDFNLRDPDGLSRKDHDQFRASAHLIEHELLEYPYRESTMSNRLRLDTHPIEEAGRVASIVFMNTAFIVSPPASGLARALVGQLRITLSNTRLHEFYTEPRCLDLLAWAHLLGVHLSRGQLNEPWFIGGLAEIINRRGWRSWPEILDAMRGYMYMPRIHETTWMNGFHDAMAVAGTTLLEEVA